VRIARDNSYFKELDRISGVETYSIEMKNEFEDKSMEII
jgi:hypothetical protein